MAIAAAETGLGEGELRRRRLARLIVLSLAWIKTALAVIALLAGLIIGGGSDPAGRAMGAGFVAIPVAYWLVLVLPVLILGRKGRLLGLCLALLLLPEIIFALVVNTL